mmetsp:Transcript_33351/g.74773  ORF Transcript_33351/g.74773 Transcript_33351/m.74773 type:complete len:216 (-) Transcript_33351:158-805(-)|eukprot:767696-Hanusia_phi.AAC.2
MAVVAKWLSAAVLAMQGAEGLPVKEEVANSKPWFCHGLGCPSFTVLSRNDSVELRRYEESLWATTKVACGAGGSSFDSAKREGFMRLFRYIAGNNSEHAKIDMTAPVLIRIDSDPAGKFSDISVSFFMANGKPDVPEPGNSQIFLEKIPQMEVFVSQYSTLPPGPSEGRVFKEAESLKSALASGTYDERTFFDVEYDPPFRIFGRHDEIWIKKIA